MFEQSPDKTPSDKTVVPPLTDVAANERLKFWKRIVRPKQPQPLETTLKPILAIYERSFGPESTQSWPDATQRARTLILLLRAIRRETFNEAHAQRDHVPLAQSFLTRVHEELRGAAPLLDAGGKAGLFRCGYPLGTGPGSLTELYIHDELARRGEEGIMELFSQCMTYEAPVTPWTEEVLRAANGALRDPSPKNLQNYLLGISLLYTTCSPLALRVNEFFDGLAATASLSTLVTVYSEVRSNKHVAAQLKHALLSEILHSIDTATGKSFSDELRTVLNTGTLPEIAVSVVPLVQRCAQNGSSTDKLATNDIATLQKTVAKWLGAASLPHNSPCASDGTRQKKGESVRAVTTLQPTSDKDDGAESEQTSASDLVKKLISLNRNALSAYLTDLLSQGLRDPSSELSKEFTHSLESTPITKLLVMRKVFANSEDVPDLHKANVQARIQEQLSQSLPDLKAETLISLYQQCVLTDSPRHEVTIVRNALRSALRLPPVKDEVIADNLSDPGRRVWGWIFSNVPVDRELLVDIVRTRLSTLMVHVARNITLEVELGSILDAVVDYANEVGALKSFKPSNLFLDVPVWKLCCFTAHLRRELGQRHGIVDSMLDVIRTRLLTKDPERDDMFPTSWKELFDVASVEEVCADMRRPILDGSQQLSLEELTCLLNNAYFIGRRGPTQLTSLRDFARREFVQRFLSEDPGQFQSLSNEHLRRSVQSLAAARWRSLDLLNPLAEECVRRADSLSPHEFADIAVAFAEVRAGTPDFWSAFAAHIDANWECYERNKLLSSMWGLCVAAPDQVPARFNASILRRHPLIFSLNKVTQSLIALGRYTPRRTDRAYAYLRESHSAFEPHSHEADFLQDLPKRIGVPDDSLFPQVLVGGFETDGVVDFGQRRLIIELDGTSHFLEGPDGGILQGKDVFQDLVFTKLGYEVFHFRLGWKDRSRRYDELREVVEDVRRSALNPEEPPRVYCDKLPPRA